MIHALWKLSNTLPAGEDGFKARTYADEFDITVFDKSAQTEYIDHVFNRSVNKKDE